MFSHKQLLALITFLTLAHNAQAFKPTWWLKRAGRTINTTIKTGAAAYLLRNNLDHLEPPVYPDNTINPSFVYCLVGGFLLLDNFTLTFAPQAYGLQNEVDEEPCGSDNTSLDSTLAQLAQLTKDETQVPSDTKDNFHSILNRN